MSQGFHDDTELPQPDAFPKHFGNRSIVQKIYI